MKKYDGKEGVGWGFGLSEMQGMSALIGYIFCHCVSYINNLALDLSLDRDCSVVYMSAHMSPPAVYMTRIICDNLALFTLLGKKKNEG